MLLIIFFVSLLKIDKMEKIKFNIDTPKDIKFIINLFNNNGFEMFLVGGCVRDSYLKNRFSNLKIKDWDLVTNANPSEVERLLNFESVSISIYTIAIGEKFGVINAITSEGGSYEIATMRSDGEYNDSRRPDSVTFGSIEDDSQRRDLTINSLYYDVINQEIIDFNNGVDDLDKGIIRTVGDPRKRFEEDRLRVLRTIRFANRYRFTLSSDLELVLRDNLSLAGVSKERIRNEFLSTLKSAKNKSIAVKQFEEFNFLSQVFVGLDINLKKIKEITNVEPLVAVAFMLRDNDINKLSKILNILTYSKDEVKLITFLVSLFDFDETKIVEYRKKLNSLDIPGSPIKQFTRIAGLKKKLIQGLILFKLKEDGIEVSKEFNVKGSELGKKIKELETENFKNFIKNGFK